MRVFQSLSPRDIKELMRSIGVDPYGIRIMQPKALNYSVKIDSVPCILANILKQEMLSLGADAAVARGALTGKAKKTGCLLIGNLSQFGLLKQKLKKQPFGMERLGLELAASLENFCRSKFILRAGSRRISLGKRTCVMGIVNCTPDSFSGDGLYPGLRGIEEYAEKLVREGADIIDVGGESSRPGAGSVSVKEELKRTIPVIKRLARRIKAPISIDTCKPEVARQALDSGAVIVNDITGLKDPLMAKTAARHKAAVVVMHMQGDPRTMQKRPRYSSLIDEVIGSLAAAVRRAGECGVGEDSIIVDPGIGFGKTLENNLEILRRLPDFKVLGKPIMVGTSRKSFIGRILKAEPKDRILGTVSSCVLASALGADIVRVHDVGQVKRALMVSDSILG